jgi:protein ImuB
MQAEPSYFSERRILCVYLPRLLSEVIGPRSLSLQDVSPEAELRRRKSDDSQKRRHPPTGIVLVDSSADECNNVRSNDRLDAVSRQAERAGVRAGQTITEARALVADLQIVNLEREEVELRLIAVAEVVRKYGMTVSWHFPDTVWVDTTGVSHLYGSEEELAVELQEQVRLLGHVARVCLAAGPFVSRALARFGTKPCAVVPREQTAQAMGELPLLALPLSAEKVAFLSRLGLFTVAELRALPEKTAASRLGENALEVLALAQGVDRSPLKTGEFPRVLSEEIDWDDLAFGLEPLLFALRGLLSRLSARLRGRGEACSRLELCLRHDPAIARHRGVLSQTLIELELSTPLYQEGDLERALKSRLSKLELRAPTIGLKLCAEQLSPALMDQMGLAEASLSGTARSAGAAFVVGQGRLQELALLLAELEADVGPEGLGTLSLRSHLRPEARSVLEPVSRPKSAKKRLSKNSSFPPSPRVPAQKSSRARAASKGKAADQRVAKEAALYLSNPSFERITRLVRRPRPLGTPLSVGASFGMGNELYTIESLRFVERLDGVEWWTPEATSRDYFWAWLSSPCGGAEALLFVDRNTKETYLQAWGD